MPLLRQDQCKYGHSEFELGLLIPFLMTITIMLIYIYIYIGGISRKAIKKHTVIYIYMYILLKVYSCLRLIKYFKND